MYLLDVRETPVIGNFLANLVGDVENVHEPASVRGYVRLLDGEV